MLCCLVFVASEYSGVHYSIIHVYVHVRTCTSHPDIVCFTIHPFVLIPAPFVLKVYRTMYNYVHGLKVNNIIS